MNPQADRPIQTVETVRVRKIDDEFQGETRQRVVTMPQTEYDRMTAEIRDLREFKREFMSVFGQRSIKDVQSTLEQSATIIRGQIDRCLDSAGAPPGRSPTERIESLGRLAKNVNAVLFKELFMYFFKRTVEVHLAKSGTFTLGDDNIPESLVPEFTREALVRTRAAVGTLLMESGI